MQNLVQRGREERIKEGDRPGTNYSDGEQHKGLVYGDGKGRGRVALEPQDQWCLQDPQGALVLPLNWFDLPEAAELG